MKKHFILPSLIYGGEYDNNSELDTLVNKSLSEISSFHGMSSGFSKRNDGYPMSLSFKVEDLPENFLKFLNNSIEEVLFLEQLKYEKFEIVHIWINVHNKKWNNHMFHVHKNSLFSGVYYYSTLENDSIEFVDKNETFNRYFHLVTQGNKTYGEKNHTQNVSSGNLLIFRSDLMHGVKSFPYDEKRKRISISFNIDLKGIGNPSTKTYK